MNRAAILLLSALPFLIAGCGSNARKGAAYPFSIEVNPPNATVWVYEAKEASIAAALEQPGPTATFELPEGNYLYKVRSPGHVAYEGAFSLPQNRELSVWLSRW